MRVVYTGDLAEGQKWLHFALHRMQWLRVNMKAQGLSYGSFRRPASPTVDVYGYILPTGLEAVYIVAAGSSEQLATTVDIWLDHFDGSGTLATHLPDIGGAYTAESGTGDLADGVLDGAGALIFGGTPNSPFLDLSINARSSIPTALPDTYSVELLFTVTQAGTSVTAGHQIYLSARVAETATADQLEFALYFDAPSGLWALLFYVANTSTFHFNALAPTISLNVEHTLLVNITPSGTALLLDDATLDTVAIVPDLPLDRMQHTTHVNYPGGAAKLNKARIYAPA